MDNRVILSKEGKKLTVSVSLEQPADRLVLRIFSDRSQPMSCWSDRSRRDPTPVKEPSVSTDVWFPVVDVALDARMEGEVCFDPQMEGTCACNYAAWRRWNQIHHGVARIPGWQLMEWENNLFADREACIPVSFALIVQIAVPLSITQQTDIPLTLLSSVWSGRVQVYAVKDEQESFVGEASITCAPPVRKLQGQVSQTRETLMAALQRSIGYLLSSQNGCIHTPWHGGFYLLYDLDARTYRQPAWPWGWGPAIRALLESRKWPEITALYPAETLLASAREAGQATLSAVAAQDDPWLDGLSTARWDPNPHMPGGMRERVNVAADSGFLSGWAWSALYEQTGDERFLEAIRTDIEKTNRFVQRYGVPPQDYCTELGQLSAHTLDESGFGMEAYAALYQITGDKTLQAMGKAYMDAHLQAFERPDGLWERSYYGQEKRCEPCIYMTRGLGWAMEGLLATYELTNERTYLQRAERLAEHMLRAQSSDGAWAFAINRSAAEAGADDKGTPLWSLLFYRLYKANTNPVYLEAARRALSWCMAQQVIEGEPESIGGIPGANPHSGIVYRPWFEISCLYASGFFALALQEELKLQQGD